MWDLTRFRLKRTARRLLWPRPALFFPFGVVRNRGNVFRSDYHLYISGFPRSGNTFALKAFQLANPEARIRSHKHIPAFVVQSVRRNMPGIVLIRNPIDAALSWTIYTRQPLRESLAYFNDYYSVLLPYREALHFVAFEDVVHDFGKVIGEFNTRWGTNYLPFEHTPENVSQCMTEIESEYVDRRGKVIENKVPRPSVQRKLERDKYLAQLNHSSAQMELQRANELFQMLAPSGFARKKPATSRSSTQNIQLRPAV